MARCPSWRQGRASRRRAPCIRGCAGSQLLYCSAHVPLCMGLLVGYPHGPLPLVATRPGNNGGGHLLCLFVLFSVLLHL